MPNDPIIDIERHLLGVLIRDAKPLPDGIIPSDFIEPSHQDIASAIASLVDEGISGDELTVTMLLRQRQSPVQAYFVSDLTTSVGFSTYNATWADEVRRHSNLRLIASVTKKASELATDTASDPLSIIAYTEGSLKSVHTRSARRVGAIPMTQQELLAFDRHNDPNSVLGNRWLCKGGSALIVSQAGVGKSSLMMQAAVHWAVGGRKDFFGIRSRSPLRVAVIQAENDFGDVAEAYQDVVKGAQLFQDEEQRLSDNLRIYRDFTSVGEDFCPMLRDVIVRDRAELVFIDPLLSFAGIDIADQQQASRFLRHDLNRVLVETQAVLIAMHHTTKPRSAKDKEGQTVADLAYSGAGSSEFVNYFREVAVLVRQQGDQPIFKFGLTKRRGRAGLRDFAGDFAGEIAIRHSRTRGEIRWEYATPDEPPDPQQTDANGARKPREW